LKELASRRLACQCGSARILLFVHTTHLFALPSPKADVESQLMKIKENRVADWFHSIRYSLTTTHTQNIGEEWNTFNQQHHANPQNI
jgi:hypothetical protein